MSKQFQRVINMLVLFMFVGWWVWPFVESFLPYEDKTIPDGVLALDEEIDQVLSKLEPTFGDLYRDRSLLGSYDFNYATSQKPLSDQKNYAENVESIVYISTEDAHEWVYTGSGSILTKDGVILTTHHTIEGSSKVVVTTADGSHHEVEQVIASDELLDVTFLKIDANNLRPIPIGDSDEVVIGDKTLVIGHAEGFLNTLSVGNIAGIRSYESQGAGTNIQITNPVSMGNSGGAVINEYGEIIAVPTWTVEYDQNSVQVQNLNFAVPINEALELLEV